MSVHWVELPFEEGGCPKRVERGHVTRRDGQGTWYERRVSWGQSPADGGPSRRHKSARDLELGRNGVVVGAMGENDSRGGGRCSRWLVWRSWESRGRVEAVDGGGDGGGG